MIPHPCGLCGAGRIWAATPTCPVCKSTSPEIHGKYIPPPVVDIDPSGDYIEPED